MRIICRVAAEFTAPNGKTIFNVAPSDRLVILEAPDEIQKTLMYKWLLADGSIEVVGGKASQKKLENDPVQDTGADGKKKAVQEKPVADEAAKEIEEQEAAEEVEEPAQKSKRAKKG